MPDKFNKKDYVEELTGVWEDTRWIKRAIEAKINACTYQPPTIIDAEFEVIDEWRHRPADKQSPSSRTHQLHVDYSEIIPTQEYLSAGVNEPLPAASCGVSR